MKILIEISEALRVHRGWGRYNFELVSNLLAIDHENQYTLFYHEPENPSKEHKRRLDQLAQSNVRFHPIALSRRDYDALEEDRTRSYLDSVFPEADIYHAVTEFPFYTQRIPKITTIHEISPLLFPWLFSEDPLTYFLRYIEEACETSQHIITVSEATKRDLRDWFFLKSSEATAIVNGISSYFFERPIPQPTENTLLYVGPTSDPLKGFEQLWSAFQKGPKTQRLQIISNDTDHPSFCAHRNLSANLAERVEIFNSLSDEELHTKYREASVLVYPSLHEGFGLPIAEALAVGLPVVAQLHSGIEEFARNHVHSFTYNSPTSLQEAIIRAEQTTVAQREEARDHVRNLTWRKSAEKHLKVFETVHSTRTKKRPLLKRVSLPTRPISLAGSYRSMGRTVGDRYPDSIPKTIAYCTRETFADFSRLKRLPTLFKTLLRRLMGAIYWFTFDQPTKEFIKGTFSSPHLNISFLDLVFINAYPEPRVVLKALYRLFRPSNVELSCNGIGYAPDSDTLPTRLHARNLDHALQPELADVLRLHVVVAPARLPFACISFIGTLTPFTGMNAAGLSFSEIGAGTRRTRVCRPWSHQFRTILETCHTKKAIGTALNSMAHSYSHRFFFVTREPCLPFSCWETDPTATFEVPPQGETFALESEKPTKISITKAILARRSPETTECTVRYWNKRSQSFQRLTDLRTQFNGALTLTSLKIWLKLTARRETVMQSLTDNENLYYLISPTGLSTNGSAISARYNEFHSYDLSRSLLQILIDKKTTQSFVTIKFPLRSVKDEDYLIEIDCQESATTRTLRRPAGTQHLRFAVASWESKSSALMRLSLAETKETLIACALEDFNTEKPGSTLSTYLLDACTRLLPQLR